MYLCVKLQRLGLLNREFSDGGGAFKSLKPFISKFYFALDFGRTTIWKMLKILWKVHYELRKTAFKMKFMWGHPL